MVAPLSAATCAGITGTDAPATRDSSVVRRLTVRDMIDRRSVYQWRTVARTLDPAAHALRRDEFIDAAQRLIQSRGYEQMSVQDVLDELGASKGAFYHYFDSKEGLLTAVVDQMIDGAMAVVEP